MGGTSYEDTEDWTSVGLVLFARMYTGLYNHHQVLRE